MVVCRSPADFAVLCPESENVRRYISFCWRKGSKSAFLGEHLGSMKQSSFLLVEPAENLRYCMFAVLELGCRWGARGATSVTEVFSEAHVFF